MNFPPAYALKGVNINNLVPGELYYARSIDSRARYSRPSSRFRGVFTGYWVNDIGYKMVRFHNVVYVEDERDYVTRIGSPEESPLGLWWRVWEDGQGQQSYAYYRVSRFSSNEMKELKTRCILHTRRQYERGLTGSTPDNKWFPRDVVREISLKYLTDSKIGCAGRWR
jgi:hypothetical protein